MEIGIAPDKIVEHNADAAVLPKAFATLRNAHVRNYRIVRTSLKTRRLSSENVRAKTSALTRRGSLQIRKRGASGHRPHLATRHCQAALRESVRR